MFATLLVVGMSCWLAMFSLAEADPADQTAAPPLFDNLGSLHHPITTTSEQAQRYFDQGLRLVYAFNHEEAIRSFEAAAQQDPQAAMPYWGIALALGPNINSAMEKKDEHRAIEMVQKARRLADHATPGEQAYIDALVTRYVGRKGAKRKGLDEAYAKAMRSVAQRFPEDADAATLFAEALMDLRPWDLWKPDGATAAWHRRDRHHARVRARAEPRSPGGLPLLPARGRGVIATGTGLALCRAIA